MDLSLADGSLVAENVSQLVAAGSAVLVYSIADKANLMRYGSSGAGAVAIVPKSQSHGLPSRDHSTCGRRRHNQQPRNQRDDRCRCQFQGRKSCPHESARFYRFTHRA